MSSKKAQQTIEAAKKEDKKKAKSSSSDDSSDDSSDSSEDTKKAVKKPEAKKEEAKKAADAKKPETKKNDSSSSDSDSDSDSESSSKDKKKKIESKKEEPKKVETKKEETKKADTKKEEPKKADTKKEETKKKKDSSSSDSDSDSDSSSEEQKKPPAKQPETKKEEPKKKGKSSSSDDSDSDSSDDSDDKKPTEDKKRKADDIDAQAPPSKKLKTENGGVATGSTSTAPVADIADEDKDITKIFVGNLSFKVEESNMHETFKDCGQIIGFDWFTDKATGRFKGCGILEFATPAEAQKALALNGTVLLDRDMTIKLSKRFDGGAGDRGGRGRGRGARGGGDRGARGPSEKPEGCDTVFLGNLPNDVTEEEVLGAFGDCGEIAQVRWVEKDGEFKGIAFVQFTESDATDKAVGKNGSVSLKGRTTRIDYASRKSRN